MMLLWQQTFNPATSQDDKSGTEWAVVWGRKIKTTTSLEISFQTAYEDKTICSEALAGVRWRGCKG